MRSRALVLLLALLPLALLIGCFGVSIDASAEDERKLSASDCRAIWGDSLPCTYSYADVDYTGSFNYSGYLSGNAANLRGINIENNAIIGSSSWNDYTILVYTLHTNLGSVHSIRNMHIDFIMNYDTYIRGCFAIGTWATVSNVAQSENLISSYPNNKFANVSALSANSSASANFANYYNVASCSTLSGYQFDYRIMPYEFAGGGVFEDGIYWDSVFSDGSGNVLFLLFTPIVRGSVSNDIPVTTTAPVTTAPSGTGDINVNVNVDMTETNGLLGSILDAISSLGSSIVNGIKNIFLPDQEDIVNWKQTIVNILNETFGGIPELEEQLKNAVSSIFSATARETVRFEGIKVPAAAGEPEAVIVPAQDVPLKPSGFGDLFSWVETFINIVATIAVANTCFNQIKRIVVGEVVVDAD